MIKYLSTEIYNYVTHKHTFIDMHDGKSTFVRGLNKDATSVGSNGTGKSLILDAIYWCNYDMTIRGFGKDAVIGPHDKYAYVKNNFMDEQERLIQIVRYRKHPKHENNAKVFIDGKESDKTRNIGISGTNLYIKKLLKTSEVAFLHSVIFSKSRESICEKKPSERLDLLTHIIGIDVVKKGLERANKSKKAFSKEIHSIDIKINGYRSQLSELKSRIKDLNETKKESISRNKKIDKTYDRELRAHKESQKKYKKQRKNIEAKLVELYDSSMEQAADEEKLQELQKKYRELNSKHGKAIGRFEEKLIQYKRSRQSIVDANKQKGMECPTCGQYISPSHIRKVVYDIKKVAQKYKQQKKYAAKTLKGLKKELVEISSIIEQIEDNVDLDMKSNIARHEEKLKSIKRKLKELKSDPQKQELIDIKRIDKKLKDLKSQQNNIVEALDNLKNRYEKASENHAVAEFWVKGFGTKGLKKFVINGILKLLESETNKCLYRMTDGYMSVSWIGNEESGGRKAEQLNLLVGTGNRGFRDYSCCSEGEKNRVWFATEYALSHIREVFIDVVFVDECFDGLDKQGVKRAIDIIKGEGAIRKMLCISHRDGIEEHFQKKVTVVMKNGTSKIKKAA